MQKRWGNLAGAKSDIMNYKVIDCDNELQIVDEEAFPVCRLDEEVLQLISFTDNANCSACIFQLAAFGVLPTYILYDVASQIQRKYPKLRFDWFTTFFHVERTNYLSTAFRMKELLENPDVSFDDARQQRFLQFEKDNLVSRQDTIILKIVMMNIINHNIKVK